MYGASNKRGGGRAGANPRMSYPPPSSARPPAALGRVAPIGGGAPRNRMSLGNPGKSSSAGAAAASSSVEEQFSLVPGSRRLEHAMIIRLTPDLVDEIRKVEAQGVNARIKFDANANNTTENVIDVGGKDFRFTWSREMGGLCDIYEERESGEGGEGVLVESACAWRKLNVQRVLDESTTSHVKKLSVEAELKHKSRQAIILDHGNLATKNQLKALAAAESNPFRNAYKQKKEPPPKKQRVESSPAGGSSRPLPQKTVLPSPASAKTTRSASPLLSTPSRLAGSVSPYETSKVSKNCGSPDDLKFTQAIGKVDKLSRETEVPSKSAIMVLGDKGKRGANTVDLRNMLVSLLTENSKGMNLKALEMAVGDAISNPLKEIELMLESIAAFQPSSGIYILKKGIEIGSSENPSSGVESFPERDISQKIQQAEHTTEQSPANEASFSEKLFTEENQEQEKMISSSRENCSAVEKNVILQESGTFSDHMSPDKNDGQTRSSSNTGSDSDSDTDSSDSDSDTDRKSKSPVRSGSSSDSGSDASTNSNEGSDEDVDIVSEDDKEQKHKLVGPAQGFSSSPIPWMTSNDRPSQNNLYDDQNHFGHVQVEVEKITLDEEEEDIEIDIISDDAPCSETEKSRVIDGPSSLVYFEQTEHQGYDGTFINGKQRESERISNPNRVSKSKSKMSSETCNLDKKSDRSRRPKPPTLPSPPPPNSKGRHPQFSEVSCHYSPKGLENNPYRDSLGHVAVRPDGSDEDERPRTGSNEGLSRKPAFNNELPETNPVLRKHVKAPNSLGRSKARDSMGGGPKNAEKSSQINVSLPTQLEKSYGEAQNEDGGIGGRYSVSTDSQYKKSEAAALSKGVERCSNLSSGPLAKDRNQNPVINGQSKSLNRELSDLEMGELRETMLGETLGVDKKFERETSFKKSVKQDLSENQNVDTNRVRPVTKETIEQGKVLPLTTYAGVANNSERALTKRTTEKYKNSHQRDTDLYNQSHLNVNDSAVDKHPPAITTRHSGEERQVSHNNGCASANLIDGENDTRLPDQKRRESSSDENSCSYSKYEKDEPDLRGPIKDFAQYNEYVQDYNSKYDSYCSLNKILESDRIEFLKLGKELESAKGEKDKEKYIDVLDRLRDSYRQSGTRHKRLKKIFIVLHEELKNLKDRMKDFAVTYSKD